MLKEFQSVFIFAFCLLAFTVVVFFVKYENERAQSEHFEEQSIKSANKVEVIQKRAQEAFKKAQEAHARRVQADKRAAESAKDATEARKMFNQAKVKSENSQKEIVATLNAQLEREADARIAAESASKELAIERDNLTKAVNETRKALALLQSRKSPTGNVSAEIERMRGIISDREAEIEKLKLRQAELERMHREAKEAQMRIEKEMSAKNYKITIPKRKRLIFPITKFHAL